jgi:hypothetical protein
VTDRAGDPIYVLMDAESGAVLGRFGRRGEGPGELSGSWMGAWESGDRRIHVVDQGNARVATFGRDGEWIEERTVEMVPAGGMGGVVRPGGGALLERWSRSPGAVPVLSLVSLAADGSTLATYADLPPLPGEYSIQKGRPIWMVLDSGTVTARTDISVYRVHDASGSLRREIRLPLTRRTVSEAEAAQIRADNPDMPPIFEPGPIAIANYMIAFGDSAFATYHGSMFRAAQDPPIHPDTTAWRIVSIRGRYLGSLVVPAEFFPVGTVQGNLLWRAGVDSLGTPVIQALELVAPAALRNTRR